jgi:hypothetical protein
MENSGESLAIVIPSFNDWAALRLLLPRIELALAGSPWRPSVLVVDDASTEPTPAGWPDDVRILRLRCNLGHQRAIALGLYYVYSFTDAQAVIVMDGDGEDRAEDLPALLEEFERGRRAEIVFAARGKRLESRAFQFFYAVYRFLHVALTGLQLRVGNFSVVPRSALTRLMAVSDLWNHYAAAVCRARLPRRQLPIDKGSRLAGTSKMNFVSLLVHGLTAISVFSDQAGARILVGSLILAGLTLVVGIAFWMVGLNTGVTVPNWAASALGWTAVLVVQLLTFAVIFVFTIVSRRSATNFVLLRDAPFFILSQSGAGMAGSGLSLLGQHVAEEREAVLRQ